MDGSEEDRQVSDVYLLPLEPGDREQFILDNQEAFRYGAKWKSFTRK